MSAALDNSKKKQRKKFIEVYEDLSNMKLNAKKHEIMLKINRGSVPVKANVVVAKRGSGKSLKNSLYKLNS
jgi:hypothetical protein